MIYSLFSLILLLISSVSSSSLLLASLKLILDLSILVFSSRRVSSFSSISSSFFCISLSVLRRSSSLVSRSLMVASYSLGNNYSCIFIVSCSIAFILDFKSSYSSCSFAFCCSSARMLRFALLLDLG